MKTVTTNYYHLEEYDNPIVRYRTSNQIAIIERYLVNKQAKILDVGCYGGFLLRGLQKKGYKQLFGLDIIESDDTFKDVSVKFDVGDISKKTKYKDNTFDITIASHTLEHVYDVKAALIEMKRITKENGYCFIILPLDINLTSRLKILISGKIGNPFIASSHIKFFKASELAKVFSSMNFQVEVTTFTGLGYGQLDLYLHQISRGLANIYPNFFAGEAYYLLKNKK